MIKKGIYLLVVSYMHLVACSKNKGKVYLYYYEDARNHKSRYFMIKDSIDFDGISHRFYYDHLTQNLSTTEAPSPLLFQIINDSLHYMQIQWPLNIKTIGACHVFRPTPEKFPPSISYKMCLKENISDTSINEVYLLDAAIFEIKAEEVAHTNPVVTIFDWNRNIIIEEKSTHFHIKLIKIDSTRY